MTTIHRTSTFEERVAVERQPTLTDAEHAAVGKLGLVRHALFNGAALTSDEAGELVNGSATLLTQAVGKMRDYGYVFEIDKVLDKNGRMNTGVYKLMNPEHEPVLTTRPKLRTEKKTKKAGKKPGRTIEPARGRKAAKTKPEVVQDDLDALAAMMPSLATSLRVVTIDISTGEPRLIVRNGEVSYMCEIVGTTRTEGG